MRHCECPNAYVSASPLLSNESALGFDLKAHLSDSSFPAVSSAKTPGAHLSMTSLWRTGSSGGGMETHKLNTCLCDAFKCLTYLAWVVSRVYSLLIEALVDPVDIQIVHLTWSTSDS